ncbi:MAG TPA: TIM-barrel domain-containing protein [Steroidobacteraceae bacterium]|nr:TIM-barrel domain-containing protein [Steroidobacteraceae bacterium]
MRLARILTATAGCLLVMIAFGANAGVAATTRVSAGHARFEFLTPSLVRMEYSPTGKFIDSPTAVVQKRDWPAVKLTSTREAGWLTLESAALTLRYRPQAGAFTAADLSVSWRDARGGRHEWRPGEADPGNLGGLTYSLDNISASTLPPPGDDLGSPMHDLIPGIDVLLQPATPGLLSRSGYAFLDDSASPVWSADHSWIEPRAQPAGKDWYLFVYDRDYRKPLEQYAQLCGPVPMIPRYALGPSITDLNFEYFPGTSESRLPAMRRYGEQHLESEVARLLESHIPLSGLVLDFAWHNYGWQGGYDWSPLIAHSQALIDWLHGRGVTISLNDHPGYANTRESSLSYSDSRAPQVLAALGRAMPPAPSYDQNLAQGWKFSPDPRDAGLKGRWYASDYDDAGWRPIRTDASWQQQGYPNYQGIGWYRLSFMLPRKLPAALYLYLGEVSGTYRLFVNGEEVQHSHVQWPRELTYAGVRTALHPGERNLIALRIEPPQLPKPPQPAQPPPRARPAGMLRRPVALRDVAPLPRIYLNLANRKEAQISMDDLHAPLIRQGVDFWWVDGGGGAASMPGLDPQLWTNEVFYEATQRQTGKRAFILSRYGGWGSERYPGFFTGDTYSEWRVLAYEVAYTARGGNVLVPYISNDIGGFHGAKIPFALYARWIEFGTFSPILRMHSAHENPLEGNLRMPWLYGPKGIALMRKYFTLRAQLVPYLYSYAWRAHEHSMPLLRPLYLEWPDLEEAYRHFHEYYFGHEMLVAPVLAADGERSVYLPPGRWMDFFTGKTYRGGATFTAHYAVDATPVFVREGSIVPEAARAPSGADEGFGALTIEVFGSGEDHFELYEDDGISLDYEHGRYAVTPLTYSSAAGRHRLVIGPTRGSFGGQREGRRYTIRIHSAQKPSSLFVNGKRASGWQWQPSRSTANLVLPVESIRQGLTITW